MSGRSVCEFWKKFKLFLSHFVVMADQFSGLDARVNRMRKIVHTCDLQHTCCFAHEKDWYGITTCILTYYFGDTGYFSQVNQS